MPSASMRVSRLVAPISTFLPFAMRLAHAAGSIDEAVCSAASSWPNVASCATATSPFQAFKNFTVIMCPLSCVLAFAQAGLILFARTLVTWLVWLSPPLTTEPQPRALGLPSFLPYLPTTHCCTVQHHVPIDPYAERMPRADCSSNTIRGSISRVAPPSLRGPRSAGAPSAPAFRHARRPCAHTPARPQGGMVITPAGVKDEKSGQGASS